MADPLHECYRCHLLKTASFFGASAGKRRSWICRACNRAQMMVRYAENKAYTDSVKMERGCADCGYRGHPAALQFDHLPGFEKRYKVSLMLGAYQLHVIVAEIAKCEVVCGNCHAIRTAERGSAAAWWANWRAEQEAGGTIAPSPELRLFEETA